LSAWRDAGGALDVKEFDLDWPPIAVSGNGTLALDNGLQPMGAFTLKFRGFFEALDGLAAEGMVTRDQAGTARLVLGLLAKRPPEGGPPELTAPFTAQDRQLAVGPLKLMEIPAVTWPDVNVP
jgi:hypothetical protein